MSMRPIIRPQRVEPLLLDGLRGAFPDVTFGTVSQTLAPPYSQCTLYASMQQQSTPVSVRCRLGITVDIARADATGDWQQASETCSQILSWILEHAPESTAFLSASYESGPIRQPIDRHLGAYAVILLDVLAVRTNQNL